MGAKALPAFQRPTTATASVLLLVCGSVTSIQPTMCSTRPGPDPIALSLATQRPALVAGMVLAGLAAVVLIREIALPYLLAMAAFVLPSAAGASCPDGARPSRSSAPVLPSTRWWSQPSSCPVIHHLAGPRWAAGALLSSMRLTTPWTLAPFWLSGIAIPLALLGLGGWRSPRCARQ